MFKAFPQIKFQFLLLSMLLSFSSFSQHHFHDDEHQHVKYELGTALTMVYSPHEKEFGPGFHIHGVRMLNPDFGIGAGYEGAFFHDYHQAVTLFGEFIIADLITIDLGPGIIFPNEEHPNFSLVAHIEASAAFDIGKIHIGPMVGYGIGLEDIHYSLGVHLGWHF